MLSLRNQSIFCRRRGEGVEGFSFLCEGAWLSGGTGGKPGDQLSSTENEGEAVEN